MMRSNSSRSRLSIIKLFSLRSLAGPFRTWFSPYRKCRPGTGLRLETLEDRCLLTAAVPDLIVQLAPAGTNSLPLAQRLAALDGLTLVPTVNAHQYRAHGSDSALNQLATSLTGQPFVQYTQRELTITVQQVPNDSSFSNQWDMQGTYGVNAPAAWDITTGSTAVTVADIDTGIDYNHPDLYLNIWVNQSAIPDHWYTKSSPSSGYDTVVSRSQVKDVDGDGRITFRDLNAPANAGLVWDNNADGQIDAGDLLRPISQGGWDSSVNSKGQDTNPADAFFGWNFVANDNDPFDDNNHGTHTAGTIGAVGNNGVGIAGLNWQTQIMAVKFLGSNGSGTDTAAAAAIEFAASNGAQVANASWGSSSFSQATYNAIKDANAKGMIFVAAAGNSSQNGDVNPGYPAGDTITRVIGGVTEPALPNLLAVAATDSSGALASFSNYGLTSVNLGAPGVGVLSTLPNNNYAYYNGTSMATPHVTGTVALMLAQFPGLSYQQVIGKLLNSTTPDAALAGKTVTGGLLNTAAALSSGPEIQVQAGTTFIPHSGGTVNFGSTLIGSPLTQTLTVTNVGMQPLTLGSITVPSGFSLTQAPASTLAAGASTTFTVQFNAPAKGTFSGTLSLATNDPDDNPLQVTLSGTVTGTSLILNDSGTTFTTVGPWLPYGGQGYLNDVHYIGAGNGSNTATWTFNVAPALYLVSATWTPLSNRATNAPYTVSDGNTALGTVQVNQQLTPNDLTDQGVGWKNLGTFTITGNSLVVTLSDKANNYVIADAIRIQKLTPQPVASVFDGSTAIVNGSSDSFGGTTPGAPVSRTFTVKNTGTLPLTLTDPISVPAGFSLTSDFGSPSLAPGASTTFSVQLTAATPGSYSGTLSFGTNDPNNSPFTFTVSGSVIVVPTTQILDDSSSTGFTTVGPWIAFGGVGYLNNVHYLGAGSGSNTATWTFTVAPGTYLVSATYYAYSNRATNAPYTVSNGSTPLGTVQVNQQLTPSDITDQGVGWKNLGTFPITGSTLVVTLSDNANNYVIADGIRIQKVTPQPVAAVFDGGNAISNGGSDSFGTTPPGAPVSRTFTVKNAGTQSLTLTDPISVPAGFTLTSDFGSLSLAPGASTTFSVQLTAATPGSYSGTLSFGTNDPNNSTFAFTVSGSVATLPTTQFLDDSNSSGFTTVGPWIFFGGQGYLGNVHYLGAGSGSNTATWTFTVTPGTYLVSTTYSAFSNRASNAPYTVSDGSTPLSTVQVNQQLTPSDITDQGVGWKNLGTFTITGNSLVVTLSDKANNYVIADAIRIQKVTPQPVAAVFDGGTAISNGGSDSFGTTPPGAPVSRTFTVKNTGTLPLTLTDPISVPAGFSLTSDFGSLSLAPGASTTFSVQLTAATPGSYSGTLSFGTNDPNNSTFSFTVSGSVAALPTTQILDDSSTGFTVVGSWIHYSGQGYLNDVHYLGAGSGSNTATWTFTVTPGTYLVSATWTAFSNRASNAPYTISNGSTPLGTVQVNQQLTPSDITDQGVGWKNLGTFTITGNTLVVTLSDNANNYVIADAIRIQKL